MYNVLLRDQQMLLMLVLKSVVVVVVQSVWFYTFYHRVSVSCMNIKKNVKAACALVAAGSSGRENSCAGFVRSFSDTR